MNNTVQMQCCQGTLFSFMSSGTPTMIVTAVSCLTPRRHGSLNVQTFVPSSHSSVENPSRFGYQQVWNQTVIAGSIRITPRTCFWISHTSNRSSSCCKSSSSVQWSALSRTWPVSKSGWLIEGTAAPFVPKDRNAPTKPAASTWLLAAASPCSVREQEFRVSMIPTRGCRWEWAWLVRSLRQGSSLS